ncbi:ATP-binding cassette domain-containing protein [Cellulomonas sp. B6]|uniref:ATP-binding cassette domain-containing protein n=1 Tax=Cellulomonas sp. B6 TaxID=1295626 RepID=UPI00073B6E4A|nr:ATP-binding cassette domain-containing protein [Cellulomonas sp. B6]KSW23741.1 ABC transporter [Cellulomonas sp. B6]
MTGTTADLAVDVAGLRKRYGTHEALRGVDLRVPAGTVLGLLGPNGAGKTTVVRVLSTLLAPDAGRARVAGFDVVREASEVRRRIGLTGQYAAVDDLLSGRGNLELVGRLQHLGTAAARTRAGELLEQFDLTEAAGRPVREYSGGMRRRLDLAASLVAEPAVLFVDEPTTGLDPPSRFTLWRAVRALVDAGTTVLLTTQYLEEADELADAVVVVDHGRTVAEGTPAELKRLVGGDRVVVTATDEHETRRAAAALAGVGPTAPDVDVRRCLVTVEVDDAVRSLQEATARLTADGVQVRAVALRPPSLDEVFLQVTGATPGRASEPAGALVP